jgi:hypothetical protein
MTKSADIYLTGDSDQELGISEEKLLDCIWRSLQTIDKQPLRLTHVSRIVFMIGGRSPSVILSDMGT